MGEPIVTPLYALNPGESVADGGDGWGIGETTFIAFDRPGFANVVDVTARPIVRAITDR
jgi:hypothetical protein